MVASPPKTNFHWGHSILSLSAYCLNQCWRPDATGLQASVWSTWRLLPTCTLPPVLFCPRASLCLCRERVSWGPFRAPGGSPSLQCFTCFQHSIAPKPDLAIRKSQNPKENVQKPTKRLNWLVPINKLPYDFTVFFVIQITCCRQLSHSCPKPQGALARRQ